jgi:hypothetical protein
MPNKVGSATVYTPAATDQAIAQGYYGGEMGDGKVKGDANLIQSNIKNGTNLFGLAGNYDYEATNPITTAQVLNGKIGFVNGVKVTGSMSDNGTVNITPGTANQTIAAGKHSGLGVVYGDGNLAEDNIRSGTSIFGFIGTFNNDPLQSGSKLLHHYTDEIRWANTTNYTKIAELKIRFDGTIKVRTQFKSAASPPTSTLYLRIYKNGVAVGTERALDVPGGSRVISPIYEEDISVSYNDLLQIYGKATAGACYQELFEICAAAPFAEEMI